MKKLLNFCSINGTKKKRTSQLAEELTKSGHFKKRTVVWLSKGIARYYIFSVTLKKFYLLLIFHLYVKIVFVYFRTNSTSLVMPIRTEQCCIGCACLSSVVMFDSVPSSGTAKGVSGRKCTVVQVSSHLSFCFVYHV